MRRLLGANCAGSISMKTSLRAAVVLVAICHSAYRVHAQERLTFTRDIAPVLFERCASCHRPGQIAPFSLLTYEDVRPRATRIADVVRSRAMPPWKPEPDHGRFQRDRRMAEAEIVAIERWVAQGMMRGSPADLPPLPRFSDAWQLGTPDLVVQMADAYVLPAQRRDVFRTFVIPIPLKASAYVKAVEFLPGNPKVVHHANIKVDRTRLSRRRDDDEPGAGYDGGGSREARFPDGMFLGWTPGQSPRVSPEGMSWRLEPQSDLVVELHLMPGDVPEPVRVSVGLFFTDERPTRTGYMLRLGRQDIDIAAGRRDYVNADTYTLPVDVDALAVQPHAHFLAKEARAWATLPSGIVVPLIYIKDWNFHWQDVYTYAATGRATQGHCHRDAVHVRQLRGESAKPESPSAARHVRANQRVRDGFAVAPGAASRLRGSRASRAGLRAQDSARRYCGQREVARSRAAQRAAARRARCVLSRSEPPGRCVGAAERGGAVGSDGRPPLRRGTSAADPAGLQRRGTRVSQRARAEACICRSPLRARGGQTRAAQSGRGDRVVWESTRRRPGERRGSLQSRARISRARATRSGDPELSQGHRAVAGGRRRASEPRARARLAESAWRSDLSVPAHARNRTRSRRCAARSRVDYRDGAERRAARAGRSGASRRARRATHQRHKCDSPRHAGCRVCCSRPNRSCDCNGGQCVEGGDGSRRAGARRRDSRAARNVTARSNGRPEGRHYECDRGRAGYGAGLSSDPATAASAAWNPIFECVPSQNGLFVDAPHGTARSAALQSDRDCRSSRRRSHRRPRRGRARSAERDCRHWTPDSDSPDSRLRL